MQYLRADGRVAFAGHFAYAGPFWQGRALVGVGAGYGILDSTGHWVLPPQPDVLRRYGFSTLRPDDDEGTDPLALFDAGVPAGYPPGVRRPMPEVMGWSPLLQRTAQGWRTRGGRQLWQD